MHFFENMEGYRYMKGVILAGGTGSRLYPNTKVTNKHLLPVYNKPMIYYPIETLKRSGIRDILVITSPESTGDFMKLLGSGIDHGVHFTYRVQDGSGGIAQALSLAKGFAGNDSLAVILSDNIFEDSFEVEIAHFKEGAHIFVKEVEDPRRFGVVTFDDNHTVTSIVEKPDLPTSSYAQTGFYIYDNQVFDYIRSIEPSERGELEITDVNQMYVNKGKLKASTVPGMWVDAGTHTSLLEANILAHEAFDPDRLAQKKSQHPSVFSKTFDQAYPLVSIGVVTYNSEKYLAPFLDSLVAQDYENIEIRIFDNNSSDNTLQIIEDHYPQVKVQSSLENLGFGKSHNRLIESSKGEFYLCMNVDMIAEPNYVSELVKGISEKATIGAVGGKIKRWDFSSYQEKGKKGKTNFIDSVGIKAYKTHRFVDIGQGEVDHGQFDHPEDVFGISGAAVLYRIKALKDVAHKLDENQSPEYFDESMFMYKEDVDLAYRLQWAGWKAKYTPHAVCYHDRTTKALGESIFGMVQNRGKKSKRVNRVSYLNHQIVLQKNFSSDFSTSTKGATGWYNLKVFLYILAFETEHIGVWWHLFKMRKSTRAKSKTMPRRVSHAEIEKFMAG